MNKLIGVLIVAAIIGVLAAGAVLVQSRIGSGVYETATVTDYRPSYFLSDSVTTVKFPDGSIRTNNCLPYRDKGDKVIATKSGSKYWRLK
jgi:uncharacterized circularly permuted ATP-grasp superfamily protein